MTKPGLSVKEAALGGGVEGTPKEGATDLMCARLSSARRVWHS